jgi:urease gamma subunit
MSSDLPFIDPTRGGSKAKLQRAPRPIDLAGKVVGLLDNTKEQGDIILSTVAEALRERYGVAEVLIQRKEFFSRPAKPELIDEMAKKVQVAIAAVGG